MASAKIKVLGRIKKKKYCKLKFYITPSSCLSSTIVALSWYSVVKYYKTKPNSRAFRIVYNEPNLSLELLIQTIWTRKRVLPSILKT